MPCLKTLSFHGFPKLTLRWRFGFVVVVVILGRSRWIVDDEEMGPIVRIKSIVRAEAGHDGVECGCVLLL